MVSSSRLREGDVFEMATDYVVNPASRSPVVTLIEPDRTWLPLSWQWIQEQPDAHLDDLGPSTYEEYCDHVGERIAAGEVWHGVVADDVPVGFIWYAPISSRVGAFHGICMTKVSQGTGVAATAVNLVLSSRWAAGVDKVQVFCFADNRRAIRFMDKVGAHQEGRFRRHAVRRGRYIDVLVFAWFSPIHEEGL